MADIVNLFSRTGMAPRIEKDIPDSDVVAAKVHTLIQPKGAFHVYRDRFTQKDVIAQEFFEVLHTVGMVTIVNYRDAITKDSILRIEKIQDCLYELPVSDFIRFTEPIPKMVGDEDIDSFLIPALNAAGLQIGMITEAEDTFTDSVMTPEQAEDFHVDSIDALFDEGFYACMIDDLRGTAGISYTIDDFIDPNIPLLYLLCHAYEEYRNEGYAMDENVRMELSHYKGPRTHTYFVSMGILRDIVLSGIIRKNPLYINFPIEKRIKKFHDETISPLLSEEFLGGEFEE